MNSQKRKVLMLGWEFPPLLTGGLGPACYGLAKALSTKVDLHLILPHSEPSFTVENLSITGLNQVDIDQLQQDKLQKVAELQLEVEQKVKAELEERQQLQAALLKEENQKRQETGNLHAQKEDKFRQVQTKHSQRVSKQQKEFEEKRQQLEESRLIRERLLRELEEERILYSYEKFSMVDYVKIQIDPYNEFWEEKTKEIVIDKSDEVREAMAKEYHKLGMEYNSSHKSLEEELRRKIQVIWNEQEGDLKSVREDFEKQIADVESKPIFIQLPEESPKLEEEELLASLRKEIIYDVTYKKYLFEDKETYGPRILDKVTAYTEVVTKVAENTEFDLIHAHDWLTIPAAVELKKRLKKPLVLHIHSLETDRVTNPEARNMVYDIEKMGMENADVIIPVSEYTKRNIIENYGVEEEKIFPVHNGIEEKEVIQSKKKNKSKTILFLGRVTHQKGVDFLIETAMKLSDKIQDLRFVIAGVGDKLRDTMFLAREKGVSDKISFLGHLNREAVQSLLAETNIYFMPSVSDPFGISALEAAQFDLPIVISKQTGATEVLPNTLQADFWDTDKFAEYIYALLNYEGLSKDLVKLTKHDLKYLTWEYASQQVMEQYEKVLNS